MDVKEEAVNEIEKVTQGREVSDPYGFASRPQEWHTEFKKKLLRKVDLRLLPMLCLMVCQTEHSLASSTVDSFGVFVS